MNGKRFVPDVFNDLYFAAIENGLTPDDAQWHAENILQQLAEGPELPHKENDDER